ncbi:hypothetical protein WEI85_09995 [Actinomycetes bacterium KLBMP 9797]
MTELHRNEGTNRSLAMKGGGVGLGALVLAALGLVIGGPLGGYMVVFLGLVGVFLCVVAAILFALSFRPFHISFTPTGLTVNCQGTRFQVSWEQVEAINIERMPTDEERYMFVVWLDPSVPMKDQPTFPFGGTRKGYAVVELSDIQETREELAAIIAGYAGAKHRSGAVA